VPNIRKSSCSIFIFKSGIKSIKIEHQGTFPSQPPKTTLQNPLFQILAPRVFTGKGRRDGAGFQGGILRFAFSILFDRCKTAKVKSKEKLFCSESMIL
jgi:hypothetical protein